MKRRERKTYEQRLWDRVERKMAESVAAGRLPMDLGEAFEGLERHPDAARLVEDDPPSGGPA